MPPLNNFVVPSGQDARWQAQKINAINRFIKGGELFPVFRTWPAAVARLCLKRHLVNRDRYFVLLFLAYNGLSDARIRQIIFMGGAYDNDARRQITWLLTEIDGRPNWARQNIQVWDLNERKLVQLPNAY
nr:hypothetical protein [Crucivirus sp.]